MATVIRRFVNRELGRYNPEVTVIDPGGPPPVVSDLIGDPRYDR